MKKSFGKGIESLIPFKKEKRFRTFKDKKEAVFFIDINKIKPNPYQPRKELNMEELRSLSESILQYGVLQPLIVSKYAEEISIGISGEYQLIAGERRLSAAKIAGLKQVPVIIKETDNKGKLEISLIENIQRQDLNVIDKAEAFKRLQEEFNLSQKEIAKLAGKSREAVNNTLRLLDLSEQTKQILSKGKISEGHGRAILMVKKDSKKKILLSQILKNNFSVRQAEAFAQKLNIWQPSKGKQNIINQEIQGLEVNIKKTLNVKNLKLRKTGDNLKLTILFETKKEIEDLIKKLK